MKSIFSIAVLLFGVGLSSAFAQDAPADTSYWHHEGKAGLTFNQVSLSNWAAGGTKSLAGGAKFGLKFWYEKEKWSWKNNLVFGLGFSKQGEEPTNKTDDQILFNTNVAYKLSGAWALAGNVNFRTQFVNGYQLPNDSVAISTFMAPAYLVSGVGIKFEPNEFFVIELDPISNKTLFVLDDALSAIGAYGVDSTKSSRAEFGAFMQARFKKEIVKNVTLDTYLTLFSNYLENPEKIDVNWDFLLDFKVNDWLAANFVVQLIYDDDIRFGIDSTGDGVNDSSEARVQIRQALGIGFVGTF
jgi:hypothetical protein